MAFGDLTAIGSHTSVDASATRTITVGVAGVPAGKTIVVFVAARDSDGSRTPTCADNVNASYSSISLSNGVSDNFVYYFRNNAALVENDTITISNVQSGQAVTAYALYVDGLDLTAPLLVNQTASGSADSVTSGDFAWSTGVQGAQELWLGFLAVAGTTAGTEDASGNWTAVYNQAGSGAGGTSQNRSIRIAKRVVTGVTSGTYAPTTGGTQTRYVSVISFRAPSARVFWYPKTCSEDHGCILHISGPSTLTGIAKTCIGHATSQFGRQVGLPNFAGLFSQPTITGDSTAFSAIVTQNIAGTEETTTRPFLAFDEMRIGSVSGTGLTDLLMVYQSAITAPGDSGDTDPPNVSFLNTTFTNLKNASPSVERVVFDQEGWWDGNVIPANRIQFYLTLIETAKNYWADVGVYSGIPERYTGHLTGGSANAQRKANWIARNGSLQQIWDAVNSVYPSFYFINPTHNNATLRDQWYQDNLDVCEQFAPGKPVYPVFWPRVHQSVDPNMPYIGGTYFRSAINYIYTNNPTGGLTMWLQAGNADPRQENPVPDWWTELVDFLSDNSIQAES